MTQIMMNAAIRTTKVAVMALREIKNCIVNEKKLPSQYQEGMVQD